MNPSINRAIHTAMNPTPQPTALLRFLRFNLVGLMGIAIQLSALAILNRTFRGHLLLASAAAVELTLLHNFAWHLRYTWPDRANPSNAPISSASPDLSALCKLLRFHLSDGLISLAGTLILMPLFVRSAHLPVLVSNALTIACCGLANFLLAHHWAFRSTTPIRLLPTQTLVLSIALPLATSTCARAQTKTTNLPQAPAPMPSYQPSPSATYLTHAGYFCGIGASSSPVTSKPTFGCGAGITLLPLPLFFEFGVMGPQANRSPVSGYISLDASIPLARPTATYLPLAIVGYSRLFETGHALDYGLALALPRPGRSVGTTDSMRIELRDYYTFANPAQHNVMLRIGMLSAASD